MSVKKTWIKVKRGLLQPKHVQAIGPALWLFEVMIDTADWESGKVFGWTDAVAARELGIKPNTARDWRQRLERYGYISCRQMGQSLEIQVHNWTNPREYTGEVSSMNETRPADVGDAWEPAKGDVQTEPSNGKGDVQGDVQGDVSPQASSFSSHVTSHRGEGITSISHFRCPKCGTLVLSEHRESPIGQDCKLHCIPHPQWPEVKA